MQYKSWITIHINHAFFEQERKCGMELMPSPDTVLLLKKANVLFRKQDATAWMLIKPSFEEGETDRTSLILKEDDYKLVFYLRPLVNTFYCFSDIKESEGDAWKLVRDENSLITQYNLRISITDSLIRETKKIQVEIQSKEAYWEFVLIPKYAQRDAIIELRENNSRLAFTPMQNYELPGEGVVLRCTTTEKVAMKEIHQYRIRLWEKGNNGERILNNYIPLPKPEASSILNQREAITSYIYY